MDKKIGFIGCGNMGKAILGGLIASGQVLPGQIWVYTPSPDKVAALHDEYGINAAESAQDVAQIADIVFGAVKPNIMIKVLSDITSSLNKDTLVVSIAAGVTLEQHDGSVLDRPAGEVVHQQVPAHRWADAKHRGEAEADRVLLVQHHLLGHALRLAVDAHRLQRRVLVAYLSRCRTAIATVGHREQDQLALATGLEQESDRVRIGSPSPLLVAVACGQAHHTGQRDDSAHLFD